MRKDHELIIDLSKDKKYPLNGFIAIHSTKLGPALGGTRIFKYKNKSSALEDVMKLSRAMTAKSAIAGLPFGGGKGVIIADPKQKNINSILINYAHQVKKLKGRFFTGEDVGLTFDQVQMMLKYCPYFIGKADQAGDPSEFAALSSYKCIRWMAELVLNKKNLKGIKVGVRGVGKTGKELVRLLLKARAKVYYYDIDQAHVRLVRKLYPKSTFLSKKKFETAHFTVLAPCAMGNDVTQSNLDKIYSKMIIGTANNQLERVDLAEKLFKKNILHVPDFISNAGGLINVADELLPGHYKYTRVIKNIEKLKLSLNKVYRLSVKTGKSMDYHANQIVAKKLALHK